MKYGAICDYVGKLYGNLLHRKAGPDGFDHYLYLINDRKILAIHALQEFLVCQEFYEEWILNDTPNQISKKLTTALLGVSGPTKADTKEHAMLLAESGYPALVSFILKDSRMLLDNNDFPVFVPYEQSSLPLFRQGEVNGLTN